ncbi:MAG: EVE domain-containing protein [Prochlorothrix sp.]
MKYWLLKSEPDVYSITDLQTAGETLWDGVRNYQARNFLRSMAVGDCAFFYHSNTKPPGIAGLMTVTASDVVDPSQFDPQSQYFDPKSSPEAPRWRTAQLAFAELFPHYIPLDTLKAQFSPDELGVVKRGNRLSVLPVPASVAQRLLSLGRGSSA